MHEAIGERKRFLPAVHPTDRIVIPVEGTDREYLAQMWAVQLAADMQVPVIAVHVVDGKGGELTEAEMRDRVAYLAKECESWGVEFHLRVVQGTSVADELVKELTARDLAVIGTRRLGGHFHVGSVAAELIRRAPCPVQVVRLE